MTTERSIRPAQGSPWTPVAYPTLIGGAFFLFLFVASGASPFAAVRMILVAVVGCILLTVVCGAALRDRHRGALLALALVLLLITGNEPAKFAALALGAAMLVVERLASARRPSRVPFPVISRVGNAVGVIIVLSVVVQAVQQGTLAAVVDDVVAEGPAFLRPGPTEPTADAAATSRPDIYVVLLDGYARSDKQATLFGHDNSDFLAALTSRGFDVAEHSRSNYLLTAVSLASTLNLRQLDGETELAALPVTDVRHVRGARRLINDNEVFRRLHRLGYETVAISSGFEEVALRRADVFIDTGQLNEVELLTFRHTLLGPLVGLVAPDLFADQQRDRIRSTFERAAEVAGQPHERPRLVFVHVPSPHAPVVFDADGGPVPARDLPTFYEDSAIGRDISRAEYAVGYVGQVQYLNGRTLELVDTILGVAKQPPIVLVMSDHGSASGVDFGDWEHSDLDERTANLFAAYTPGRSAVFDDRISLVNVFGRLFNAYFGTAYPTNPDTVYRWTGDSIFHLVAVPGIVAGR